MLMYLLVPFIVQNFKKKTIVRIQSYEKASFFWPEMVQLSQK